MDGVSYYVQKGKRILPQGSLASPAISNLIAYKLDKKVKGLADKFGFTYTRYADDLSFSAGKESEKNISGLLHYLDEIIQSEGLTINPEKTHIMRSGGQQKVTGIVVNEVLNVERTQLRKFRALLHNIEKNGWNGQKWGRAENILHSIEGYIHFIKMVNPAKSEKYSKQLTAIVEKYGCPQTDEIAIATTPSLRGLDRSNPENAQPESNMDCHGSELPRNDVEPEKTSDEKPEKSGNDWWNIFS